MKMNAIPLFYETNRISERYIYIYIYTYSVTTSTSNRINLIGLEEDNDIRNNVILEFGKEKKKFK